MNLADYNNPLLTTPLEFIEEPEKDIEGLKELSKQMYQLVAQFGGAGLSANQIGINKRMFVVKYGDYEQTFINPKITWFSDQKIVLEEGCLTFPGVFIGVKRPDACRVTFMDSDGNHHEEMLFTGISNRIIQHEYDHMEGKFYYDHISKMQMNRLKKKMKKKLGINLENTSSK
jgi:peptide deformylase